LGEEKATQTLTTQFPMLTQAKPQPAALIPLVITK
jgi:hypothetical protein